MHLQTDPAGVESEGQPHPYNGVKILVDGQLQLPLINMAVDYLH